ncbi:MAG: ATP-binding protein [Desulfatirhabdiaceae bacterium]
MRTEAEKDYLIRAIDALEREMIVMSPDFQIVAANRRSMEKRGQDIVGKRCHHIYFKRDEPCEECPAVFTFGQGKPVLRHLSRRPDETSWVSCYPIFSNGDVEALVMLDFDLPRLDQLEEQIHRHNNFLKNMINSAVDGIIAADRKGKIFLFNQSAAEVSGYSVEEALNTLYIQDIYPNRGAWDVMKKLRSDEYGGKGRLKRYQVEVLGKNEARIPISLYASILYENGEEVGTVGFFHDLRDRLRLKRELENTQIQLLQTEKMASLGKLAAGVAHQLNNPLGGIMLYTKLILEEYELNDAAIDDLNRIMKDAERCKDTVKELLVFARQTRQEKQLHDINKAISRTLFLLEKQTLFHNIVIQTHLAPDLPLVLIDIQQINHLLMNVILNAAQAMEGKGQLSIETDLSSDSHHVVIKIADTGPGIPDSVLPHIFEPFFTTKEEGKGTGLGLSMVYGIVENHEGRITATNQPDRGAIFAIELPINLQQDEPSETRKHI